MIFAVLHKQSGQAIVRVDGILTASPVIAVLIPSHGIQGVVPKSLTAITEVSGQHTRSLLVYATSSGSVSRVDGIDSIPCQDALSRYDKNCQQMCTTRANEWADAVIWHRIWTRTQIRAKRHSSKVHNRFRQFENRHDKDLRQIVERHIKAQSQSADRHAKDLHQIADQHNKEIGLFTDNLRARVCDPGFWPNSCRTSKSVRSKNHACKVAKRHNARCQLTQASQRKCDQQSKKWSHRCNEAKEPKQKKRWCKISTRIQKRCAKPRDCRLDKQAACKSEDKCFIRRRIDGKTTESCSSATGKAAIFEHDKYKQDVERMNDRYERLKKRKSDRYKQIQERKSDRYKQIVQRKKDRHKHTVRVKNEGIRKVHKGISDARKTYEASIKQERTTVKQIREDSREQLSELEKLMNDKHELQELQRKMNNKRHGNEAKVAEILLKKKAFASWTIHVPKHNSKRHLKSLKRRNRKFLDRLRKRRDFRGLVPRPNEKLCNRATMSGIVFWRCRHRSSLLMYQKSHLLEKLESKRLKIRTSFMPRCLNACSNTCSDLDTTSNACKEPQKGTTPNELPKCYPDLIPQRGVNGTLDPTSNFRKRWMCQMPHAPPIQNTTNPGDILHMSATNAARALGMWPLNRREQPWSYARLGKPVGYPSPSSYLSFVNVFCLGTCGYMCSNGHNGTTSKPVKLSQSPLGAFPGILSVVAINSKMLLTSNVVSHDVSTTSLSLAFNCEKLLAANSTASDLLDKWEGTEDGELMQSPAIDKPPYFSQVTSPASNWQLTIYKKRLKVTSNSAHGFFNKVLICTVELDLTNKPIDEESCCVDKELTPPEAAKDKRMVSKLKAW